MFSENNLGKDYSNMSKHELQLLVTSVCNNEKDVDKSLRSIAAHVIYYINKKRFMTLPSLVDISRIKKFKDLCDEDIVGHLPITNIIKEIYLRFQKEQFIANIIWITENLKKYSLPIFIILSLLGNCLSAIVLFRKKMRSSSSNIYLGVLAICDIVYTMYLLIDWLFIVAIKQERKNIYFFYFDYLRFFSQFLSVWLVVAFTIERYIATKSPLLHRSWCTVKRAKIVVITLMGLAILHSILQNFIISRSTNYKLMNKKEKSFNDRNEQVNNDLREGITEKRKIIESIIIFTLPALVIVICNTRIGYHIYQQNRVRKTLIKASDSSNGRSQISKDKMLQHKITKRLIIVSSIFVLFKLPAHCYIYFYRYVFKYANIMYIIFYLFDAAHYCMNFFFYCVMGQTFRGELIRMFKKRTNKKKQKYQRDGHK